MDDCRDILIDFIFLIVNSYSAIQLDENKRRDRRTYRERETEKTNHQRSNIFPNYLLKRVPFYRHFM